MGTAALHRITAASFRANPGYELVLFDRLPPAHKELLRDLTRDPDLYGILRPRVGSGAGASAAPCAPACVKAIDRDTALLFLTLQEPGPLPAYVEAALGEQCNAVIAALVLDGVLEIEHGGAFASGSGAHGAIYETPAPAGFHAPSAPARCRAPSAPAGLARLSVDALQYAQRLAIDDVGRLSARLYFYNRAPASPERRRRFPDAGAVARYLGLRGDGEVHRAPSGWIRVSLPPPGDGWLVWARAEAASAPRARPAYKLYVSPALEAVPEAFRIAAEIAAAGAERLKIGKDLHGLLRPDKLVIYFQHLDALEAAADALARRLDGCAPHGVPFTAELAGGGLLSWGLDPPREQQALRWQERESWRLWVTNRLAAALLAARAHPESPVEPWQFALDRLQLQDVDTARWIPAPGFPEPAGGGRP